MKKQLTLTVALLSILAYQSLNAASVGYVTVDVKAIIGVQNCIGGGCSQSQALNAIGDPFDADVKTANFTDLGTITTSTTKNLQVPETVGAKTLYKFTTQDGKTGYLGMEMKPVPGRGTRYYTITTPQGAELTAGKDFNIVELYRFNDTKNEWLRNNIIFVETGKLPDPLPVALNPDGTVTVGQAKQAS